MTNSQRSQDADSHARPLLYMALQQHQIAGIADPRQPIASLVTWKPVLAGIARARAPRSERVIGRPYLAWKEDLSLAEAVNERLAPKTPS